MESNSDSESYVDTKPDEEWGSEPAKTGATIIKDSEIENLWCGGRVKSSPKVESESLGELFTELWILLRRIAVRVAFRFFLS